MQIPAYIKALLNQDHKIFKEKLEKIDAAVAGFATAFEGFADLARAVYPDAALSEQAISVLRQFEKSGASKVLEMPTSAGRIYQFVDGPGFLEVSEQRFIEDDLKILVGLKLLNQERNLYSFTRAGLRLIQERS